MQAFEKEFQAAYEQELAAGGDVAAAREAGVYALLAAVQTKLNVEPVPLLIAALAQELYPLAKRLDARDAGRRKRV